MWYLFILLKIPPKGSGKNHTPIKPLEDSSLTYNKSEDISFRVSKLEDMIKGMVSKDDLKVMTNREDLQELK